MHPVVHGAHIALSVVVVVTVDVDVTPVTSQPVKADPQLFVHASLLLRAVIAPMVVVSNAVQACTQFWAVVMEHDLVEVAVLVLVTPVTLQPVMGGPQEVVPPIQSPRSFRAPMVALTIVGQIF